MGYSWTRYNESAWPSLALGDHSVSCMTTLLINKCESIYIIARKILFVSLSHSQLRLAILSQEESLSCIASFTLASVLDICGMPNRNTGSIIWEVEGRWSGSKGYTDSPTQVEDLGWWVCMICYPLTTTPPTFHLPNNTACEQKVVAFLMSQWCTVYDS